MKFSEKVDNGPMNKRLHLHAHLDGGTDIATLVRRALAEICTVPVLLVVIILVICVRLAG